jgi:hypothetical protein
MGAAGGEPITVGTEVFTADGEKVGEVVAVHPAYVVVEKGLLFPTDVYVPREVAAFDGERLTLSVTKDQALRRGWDEPPAGADPDRETAVFPDGDRVRLDTAEDAG